MPHLFGATMVPDRAHYKHVREVQRRMSEREDKLGSWAKEKAERQKRLANLQHQVQYSSLVRHELMYDKISSDCFS
jgi:hypothetical protein